MLIGAVIYDFEDPFLGALLGELQRLTHQHGYSLMLAGFHRREVDAADLDSMLRQRLDGLLIIGSGCLHDWVQPFLDQGLAVVRIGHGEAPEGVFEVGLDERVGMGKVVDHLVEVGCDSFGFIGGEGAMHHRRGRCLAELVRERGLPWRDGAEHYGCGLAHSSGQEAMRSLLAAGELPDAVVAATDLVALGGLAAVREAGYRVPSDLKLTGFDDIPIAGLLNPPLTTVRQPVDRLVEVAWSALVREIQSCGSQPREPIALIPDLVVRESTKI